MGMSEQDMNQISGDASPIEQLDFNLYWLSKMHLTPNSADKLFGKTDVKMALHNSEMIMEKLVKDGYAGREDRMIPVKGLFSTHKVIKTYYITFEGKLLVQNGGYKQKFIDETSQNKRLENIESNQRGIAERMNRLTLFLVLIGFVALVFQIWQATKTIPHFWCLHP
jgi:hypothetical protein